MSGATLTAIVSVRWAFPLRMHKIAAETAIWVFVVPILQADLLLRVALVHRIRDLLLSRVMHLAIIVKL